jgi:hypothetical protein
MKALNLHVQLVYYQRMINGFWEKVFVRDWTVRIFCGDTVSPIIKLYFSYFQCNIGVGKFSKVEWSLIYQKPTNVILYIGLQKLVLNNICVSQKFGQLVLATLMSELETEDTCRLWIGFLQNIKEDMNIFRMLCIFAQNIFFCQFLCSALRRGWLECRRVYISDVLLDNL